MTKRLLALAVCTAMLISLAGCGDKGKKAKKVVQTSKPATIVKASTVSAGCYQVELAKIKGWNNKYRPAGQYAYYRYGTRNAQEYYEVVKAAYDIVHSAEYVQIKQAAVKEYKDIIEKGATSFNEGIGRDDNLVTIDDYWVQNDIGVDEYIGIKEIDYANNNETNAMGKFNAYCALINNKASIEQRLSARIALMHQLKINISVVKVVDKTGVYFNNAFDYAIKIIDSNGRTLIHHSVLLTQQEFIAQGYKITIYDCLK